MGALPRILALNPSQVRYVDHAGGRGHHVHRAPAPGARTASTSASASPRDLQDVVPGRGRARAGRRRPRALHVHGAALARGRVGGRALHRRRTATSSEIAASSGGRSRRPPLQRRRAGRRLDALPGSRNGRGLVFRYLERPPRGQAAPRETYYQWREGDSFALRLPLGPGGRLLILLMGHRDEVSEARERPRGLLAAQARRASRALAARLAGVDEPVHQAALDRRDAGLLPRLVGAGLGAGRATRRTSRTRSPARACATRCGWAARSPSTSCRCSTTRRRSTPRTRAWEAERDRALPARLPLRQPRHARRAPVAGPVRAGARRRPHDRARPLRPLRPGAHAAADRAAAAAGPRRSWRALWRGERPRSETLRRAVRDLRTELAIRRERRADSFRATRTRLRAPTIPMPCGRRRRVASRPPAASRARRRHPTMPEEAVRMTRIAVVQPALALGAGRGQPRAGSRT